MGIFKHIEKRFLFEQKLNEEELKEFEQKNHVYKVEDLHDIKKIPKEVESLLLTDKNVVLKAFPIKDDNGIVRFIPEPDPILIYFHTAYMNYRQISEKRNEIFSILRSVKITESLINQLYDYFSYTSGFIVMSFTAMEAFINRSIPEKYIYRKPDKKRTEEYTKEQIEKYLPFNEKKNEVLTQLTGKNFAKAHPTINKFLENLKEFRDSIVHTKTSNEGHTRMIICIKEH